ncbi:MAG: nickel pincer cofactor biosynthesis protein LarB [Acidimicrobiales bacterium]
MPEAVYCPSKSVDDCVTAVRLSLSDSTDAVLASRPTDDQRAALSALEPVGTGATMLTWRHRPPTGGRAVEVAAGTSDLAVADEARLTLEALGHRVDTVCDVGVAGLHRLLGQLDRIAAAEVVIAVAGMEGALATVLAGLIAGPVIAVPTSVGYGVTEGGRTALMAMLASCAPGVVVVGIDNGYGAACAAHRVLSTRHPGPAATREAAAARAAAPPVRPAPR